VGRGLDQVKLVHVAGARGANTRLGDPLANDADFADIMVNTVKAPTYNRHFYAGDATSIATLDTTDILTLEDIDKVRAAIAEMDIPLRQWCCRMTRRARTGLFVLYVTSRQWHYLQTRTGERPGGPS
jgi:hypothetical protein